MYFIDLNYKEYFKLFERLSGCERISDSMILSLQYPCDENSTDGISVDYCGTSLTRITMSRKFVKR